MSFYIRPKFKIGQNIFSIKNDNIEEIVIESIQTVSKEIYYLSKNKSYCESQSFYCIEEARDFLENALRIPFLEKERGWEGGLNGVRSVDIKEATCFFNSDLKTPYNIIVHTNYCFNSTCVFETQAKATQYSLEQVIKFETSRKNN